MGTFEVKTEHLGIRTNMEIHGKRIVLTTDGDGLVRQVKGRTADPRIDQEVADALRTIPGWHVVREYPANYEPPTEVVGVEDPDNDPTHPDYEHPKSFAEIEQEELRATLEARRAARQARKEAGLPPEEPAGPPLMADSQMVQQQLLARNKALEARIGELDTELNEMAGVVQELTVALQRKDEEIRLLKEGGTPTPAKPPKGATRVTKDSASRAQRPAPTAKDLGKDNRSDIERGLDRAAATNGGSAPKGEALDDIPVA